MTGYELFKRFAFERLTSGILKAKRKITFNIILGILVCSALVSGSFYLSLNGAHRLIDTKETIVAKTDSSIQKQTDSIAKYYNNEITFYRNQPARNRVDRKYRDSIVAELQKSKDNKISSIESKLTAKTTTKLDEVKENGFAFAAMVFFLEFIILIGVAFNAYYTWVSYEEMKKVMLTPKYKQLDINLNLLKLYYQNGRKKNQDSVIPRTKIIALAKASKLNVTQSEVDNFIILCDELGITEGDRQKKVYNMEYEDAKNILENN
jgi:flagellar basal body-associated protein FliL